MRTCNICGKSQGDLVERERIVIGDHGMCSTCARELIALEDLYRQDFLGRTNESCDLVIPWPAFKTFTWPPNALVLVSGWALNLREFGVGISDSYLISGRRSIAGIQDEIISKIDRLKKKLEETEQEGERRAIQKDLEDWEPKLKGLAKLKSQGERRLVSIPLERIAITSVVRDGEWIAVDFQHEEMVPKAFRGAKEKVLKERWVVSAAYEEAIKRFEERAEMRAKTSK